MISFVPFAVSIQDDLPDDFPKFVLSLCEVAFFTTPAALFQFSYWSDEEGIGFGGDILWLSLLGFPWVKQKQELEIEVELEDDDIDD